MDRIPFKYDTICTITHLVCPICLHMKHAIYAYGFVVFVVCCLRLFML